jgi:hypothetical protein
MQLCAGQAQNDVFGEAETGRIGHAIFFTFAVVTDEV